MIIHSDIYHPVDSGFNICKGIYLDQYHTVARGLKANDKWLSVKTRSRMFTTDFFPSSNIELVVQQGIVYLMGRVSEKTAAQAVEIASEVNGVQKVVVVFQIIP